MIDVQAQTSKLLPLLQRLQFSQRYYAFCDTHERSRTPLKLTRGELEELLASSGLDFTYRARENFFRHRETTPVGELTLNLAFSDGAVEPILYFEAAKVSVGGPFHKLAAQVAKLERPDFTREPPNPRLAFRNREEAQSAVALVVALYRELRAGVLAEDWA